jgi:hypothetical protein
MLTPYYAESVFLDFIPGKNYIIYFLSVKGCQTLITCGIIFKNLRIFISKDLSFLRSYLL